MNSFSKILLWYHNCRHHTLNIMTFDLTKKAVDKIQELISSNQRGAREWVYGDEGQVYLRATVRLSPQGVMCRTIDLSSIEVEEQFRQEGVFKEVLKALEKTALDNECNMFIESVIDEHLYEALPRYGYTEMPNSVPPSFWKSHDILKLYSTARTHSTFKNKSII